MRLKINGEYRDGIRAETLRGLLDELGVIPGRVAVEVNNSVIRKDEHEKFRLRDGDTVEIVNFVGGG